MMYVADIDGSILQREAFPPNQNFASQPGGVPLKGRPVASLRCGSPVRPEPSAADCGVRLPLFSLHRHRLWHRWRQGGKAVFQSRFRYRGSPRDPLFPANAGLRAAVGRDKGTGQKRSTPIDLPQDDRVTVFCSCLVLITAPKTSRPPGWVSLPSRHFCDVAVLRRGARQRADGPDRVRRPRAVT